MARNKDGTFAAGTSGNPGGRPKAPVKLRELYDANDDDTRIYNRLWDWIKSDDGKVSMAAINTLLDRRYGRTAPTDDNGEAVRDTTIQVVIPKLDDITHTPEPK